MEISIDQKRSSASESALDEARKAYKLHKPVDASSLNNQQFKQFVHEIQPLDPLLIVQRFIERLMDRRR